MIPLNDTTTGVSRWLCFWDFLLTGNAADGTLVPVPCGNVCDPFSSFVIGMGPLFVFGQGVHVKGVGGNVISFRRAGPAAVAGDSGNIVTFFV